MKILTLSALVVALSGGAAFADHRHGGWERHERVAPHHDGGVRWSGGVTVTPHYDGHYVRGYDRGYYGGGYARRPIYVGRPVIRERYFDVRLRPRVIVENYAPMNGYYWVSGQWTWSGYEWIWQPGHYEPDPSYVDPSYADPGYDPAYSGSYYYGQ